MHCMHALRHVYSFVWTNAKENREGGRASARASEDLSRKFGAKCVLGIDRRSFAFVLKAVIYSWVDEKEGNTDHFNSFLLIYIIYKSIYLNISLLPNCETGHARSFRIIILLFKSIPKIFSRDTRKYARSLSNDSVSGRRNCNCK